MTALVRESIPLFLHKDTAEYLDYLTKKWNANSRSDVVEELVRRTRRQEHKARMRKLEKNSAAA